MILTSHIWGFGKAIISLNDDTTIQAHIYQNGILSYTKEYEEIKDDFGNVVYRFFNGFRAKIEIPDITLYDTSTLNESGSMRTFTEKIFKMINSQTSLNIEPLFQIIVNTDNESTGMSDSTGGVLVTDMYLENEEISFTPIKFNKMFGQKTTLSFVGKKTVNSLPAELNSNALTQIIDNGATTGYSIKIKNNDVDSTLKIIE